MRAAGFVVLVIVAIWLFAGDVRDRWNGPRAGASCGPHHHYRDVGDAFSGRNLSCEPDR